jgi:hypothetical protein
MKEIWEILVPYSRSNGETIPISEHRRWDEKVRQISGGLTIMGLARGQWLSPAGKLFIEKMIPVRIICTEAEIIQVEDLTMDFYEQEAVLSYRISEKVRLTHRRGLTKAANL